MSMGTALAEYKVFCGINGLQGVVSASSFNEPVLQCNAHCEYITYFGKVFVGDQNFVLHPGENSIKFTVNADATIHRVQNPRIICKKF